MTKRVSEKDDEVSIKITATGCSRIYVMCDSDSLYCMWQCGDDSTENIRLRDFIRDETDGKKGDNVIVFECDEESDVDSLEEGRSYEEETIYATFPSIKPAIRDIGRAKKIRKIVDEDSAVVWSHKRVKH